MLGWIAAYLLGAAVGLAIDIATDNWGLTATFVGPAVAVFARACILAVRHPGRRRAYAPSAVTVALTSGTSFAIAMSRTGQPIPDIVVRVFLWGPVAALLVELLAGAWLRRQEQQREAQTARREWETRRSLASRR